MKRAAMKRARRAGLGILAALSFAFAATAQAHPGEGARMGHGAMAQGATAQGQAGEQHGRMQARMAERMAQHQGGHGRGREGASAGGCNMGGQGGAHAEHKH